MGTKKDTKAVSGVGNVRGTHLKVTGDSAARNTSRSRRAATLGKDPTVERVLKTAFASFSVPTVPFVSEF